MLTDPQPYHLREPNCGVEIDFDTDEGREHACNTSALSPADADGPQMHVILFRLYNHHQPTSRYDLVHYSIQAGSIQSCRSPRHTSLEAFRY